ncbi:F-box protein GID2-like protein [Drosera capensis]
MKRPISSLLSSFSTPNTKLKQIKLDDDNEEESITAVGFMNLDEDLLYEILKHADARTVGVAACVSKLWHRTAQDERIWELICTRHWTNIGCGTQQLRSVVLALGGFKQLHSQYLWPLSKSSSCGACGASSSGAVQPRLATAFSMMPPPVAGRRGGKDEGHLSLSLLSIKYFEKMNFDDLFNTDPPTFCRC